jgi:hypothetical protein
MNATGFSILLSLLVLVLQGILFWFFKPWAQGYAQEKSKNFARQEDLESILAEVRAVTAGQEEIKFRLSAEQWDRQMLATEKKVVYGDLLHTVHRMIECCNTILATAKVIAANELAPTVVAELASQVSTEIVTYTTIERELIRLTGLAAIFCRPECYSYVITFLSAPRDPDALRSVDKVQSQFTKLIGLNSYIIEFAKRDFGIA